MVQKKVVDLQTDHVKFSKLLKKNLKPSSFQHQESMNNRGTDYMMKIMKKQRQNLSSPSFRKQISQPGKLPPSMAATSSSSSKMQSLNKISEKKPNYMKPTTSSVLRKENSEPNFKNLDETSCKKKNGKSKTTPSKSVSALTKTTSFKPTRLTTATTKKSYPFVENVQKPTCSSTLKDSKFPVFLTLNSGGTESEGNSIMKVCSYTYCSLNGHHHHPLPSLKSFLSARRHMLKSIKTGSLSISPRRMIENGDVIVEENEKLQEGFLIEEDQDDDEFFIQIYSKESEDADYFLEDNNNESIVGGFLDPVINAMEEGLENQGDEEEEESNGINTEDIEAFSPFESGTETETEEGHASTLYLDDHKTDEIENKYYFEELKLDEETITGSHADLDQDFEIDETIENSNLQIDNTKFMEIEVDNEDVLKEDDNQELKNDCAVNDYYQPSDQKSESEDDNQELKKDGIIDDYYYPLSDLNSESENDFNQELQKQSASGDHYYQLSDDQKSENEDEKNQELQKDCTAFDDHYQPSDQKSENEDENQELQIDSAFDDHYQPRQPSDQKSENEDEKNQELQKDCTAFDDHYQPSDQKSEIEDEKQELQNHYQPSDQKSEIEDENQELQKDCAFDDHYQPSYQKSESEYDNQELQIDSAFDDQYHQPSDQRSESDCTENSEKTDDYIALSSDSQSFLTKKICPASDIDDEEDIISKNSKIGKWIYKQKEESSTISEENDLKGFNPRGPNFLEVEPDPESEKVDLKHQMIDDRRSSEEWMLDYALQQAVNKLAAARKKKVTLLVEAFETVSPLPKWEKPRMGVGFDLPHHIQACS